MANFYYDCPARVKVRVYKDKSCYACVLLLHINENNHMPNQDRCEVFSKGCNCCLIREKLDPIFIKKLSDIYFEEEKCQNI